jgi:hypothetical protein
MKRLFYGIIMVVIILGFSGCAGNNYHTVERTKVITNVDKLSNVDEFVIVTVKRDTNFMGGGLDARFWINGKPIVTLSRGETFTFKINPGEHKFEVHSLQPILFVPISVKRYLYATLQKNKSYEYYFVHTGHGLSMIDYREYQENYTYDN